MYIIDQDALLLILLKYNYIFLKETAHHNLIIKKWALSFLFYQIYVQDLFLPYFYMINKMFNRYIFKLIELIH